MNGSIVEVAEFDRFLRFRVVDRSSPSGGTATPTRYPSSLTSPPFAAGLCHRSSPLPAPLPASPSLFWKRNCATQAHRSTEEIVPRRTDFVLFLAATPFFPLSPVPSRFRRPTWSSLRVHYRAKRRSRSRDEIARETNLHR